MNYTVFQNLSSSLQAQLIPTTIIGVSATGHHIPFDGQLDVDIFTTKGVHIGTFNFLVSRYIKYSMVLGSSFTSKDGTRTIHTHAGGGSLIINGINVSLVSDFVQYCQKDLKLNILGLMCIPPVNVSPESYFLKLKKLNDDCCLKDLSIGMSDDFEIAIKLGSTFVRVGTAIFGKRSN
jgi:hypothetical protein